MNRRIGLPPCPHEIITTLLLVGFITALVIAAQIAPWITLMAVFGIAVLGFLLKKPVLAAYLVVLSLPLRNEIYQVSGVGIRIPDFAFLALLIVTLISFLMSKIHRTKHNVLSLNHQIILLFVVWSLLSALTGALKLQDMTTSSLIEVMRLLVSVSGTFAMSYLLSNQKQLVTAMRMWIIAALSSIALSLYQMIKLGVLSIVFQQEITIKEFWYLKFKSSPLFLDPNNYASFLILSTFIAYALVHYDKTAKNNKTLRKVMILSYACSIIMLFLTFSRSAWLGLIAGLGVLLVLARRRLLLATVGLIFTAIPVLLLLPIIQEFLIKIQSDFSATHRVSLWLAESNITLNNPLWGVGLGNLPQRLGEYLWNPYAHNLFLKISSEIGVIGLTLFLALSYRLIVFGIKQREKGGNLSVLYGGLIAGFVGYLVQGIAVEYLTSKHFWIYVAILITCQRLVKNRAIGAIKSHTEVVCPSN